jgi:hypothetical protein
VLGANATSPARDARMRRAIGRADARPLDSGLRRNDEDEDRSAIVGTWMAVTPIRLRSLRSFGGPTRPPSPRLRRGGLPFSGGGKKDSRRAGTRRNDALGEALGGGGRAAFAKTLMTSPVHHENLVQSSLRARTVSDNGRFTDKSR